MKIRKAVREDARKFGSCHYHCWQETYRGIISEDYLDNMSEQKNMDRFENIWDLRGESQYVLEENGEIIGIFDISKARESYALFEVQGLYLRKAHHGKGYGRQVMEYIKNCVSEPFYLWCLSTNPTCGYYTHMGGRIVDRKTVKIGNREETEVCFLFS